MELQYFGANCVRLSTKGTHIVVDDNLAELGLKSILKPTDIALYTTANINKLPARFTADMPGEYEIDAISITGIASRAHINDESKASATIYVVEADDVRAVILGHIYPDLSDEQIEQIGLVDAAIIPVGDSGYTLDGAGALKLVKKIEPKIVIPTHYGDKAVKYEVPQQELEQALKDLGMEPQETTDKYKLKPADLPESTHLIVLERQSV